LRHDALVSMTDSVQTVEGNTIVFDWFDGEALHPH
jgi:hypothetical protein